MLKRLIFSILLLPSILFAQHTIKGTIKHPAVFKYIYLYKIKPYSLKYISNYDIKKDGSFEIQLDDSAAPGVYKIVYAIPKDDYNFNVIYNAKEDIELVFNSETGVTYQTSLENKLLTDYTNSMGKISQSIADFYKEKSTDTLALTAVFKTQKETQKKFEEAAKNTIALEFIKANKPYIPEHYESIETYINNLESHFFDYVDFNNVTLQSSDFLAERMFNYVLEMDSSEEDTVANNKKNIDVFCLEMKEAPLKLQSSLLFKLWENMVNSGFDHVANYISDTYLMNIAENLKDQVLIYKLIQFKKISIGSVAPDFSIDGSENGKKLSDLNTSEYYIVAFWSTTCSHCLHEIPQLYKYLEPFSKEKIQVVAVALENDDMLYKNKKIELPNFIHVLGLGKWSNPIGDSYSVQSTPTYFILNKDKHIVSKPETLEALKTFFKDNL